MALELASKEAPPVSSPEVQQQGHRQHLLHTPQQVLADLSTRYKKFGIGGSRQCNHVLAPSTMPLALAVPLSGNLSFQQVRDSR